MSYSTQQLRKTCTTHTHTHTNEIFVPPPWQPPTVIDHHKTTHDQVFWRLHLSFFYFQKTILFTFFVVYTKKSLQTTLSFFGIDLEDLSGIYLKITTNIYVVFKGYLEGPLVRFFGFCSNPLSRLWLHFCSVFLGMCMENVVIGVGQSYFTATKS